MAKWLVQLSGDKFDLEDLPKWFNDPELEVVEEQDVYYLKSTFFEHLGKAVSVRSKANDLLELLVGSAKLFRPDIRDIKLGSVMEKTENGHRRHHHLLVSSIRMRSKVSAVTLSVDGEEAQQNIPRPTQWATVAGKNHQVRQALHFWVADHRSWINLFKILEIIESDVGGDIYENNWVSKSEIRRFSQTANSYSAIGNVARHAKNIVPSPTNPLKIKEACNLIKMLLERWIDSKI